MSFKITVQPSGHSFDVQPGQSVLDGALNAGIVLPYSCRNGTCSSCRGKVLQGDYDAGRAPEQLLSEQDRAEGFTLFCQAKPASDMVIESHEIRMATDIQIRKMPSRVVGLEKVRDDVMIVRLQMPTSEPFRYYPGQYLEFILKDGSRRSYSMATPPRDDNQVELHIRHMPGGVFTDHVFGAGATAMKEREILRVEAPLGSFFLREDSDAPMVFLASGTGFAPIKALIERLRETGSRREITLYWGGRRPRDLYQSELAEQWAAQMPNLRFIPVVSDAQPDDAWAGRTGFVHQAVLQDLPDLSRWQVYACGAPAMVESARRDFVDQAGLDPQAYFADAFTSLADVK